MYVEFGGEFRSIKFSRISLFIFLLSLFSGQANALPLCDYWRPLEALVKPKTVDEVLLQLKAANKSQFQHKKSSKKNKNKLCRYVETKGASVDFFYSHDFADCNERWSKLSFGERALKINSEPASGDSHNNYINFRMGLGEINVNRANQFLHDQNKLVFEGYKEWESAFVNFVKVSKRFSGLEISGHDMPNKNHRKLTTKMAFDPQKIWRVANQLGVYLLRLSSLFEINFRVVDQKGNLVGDALIESKSTSLIVNSVGSRDGIVVYTPKSKKEKFYVIDALKTKKFKGKLLIDVLVKYYGLQIYVSDLAFAFDIERFDTYSQMKASFLGAADVSVTGFYKRIKSQQFTKAVHELVEEHLHKNLKMLKTGNNGKGLVVEMKHFQEKKKNFISFDAAFESPLNVAKTSIPKDRVKLDYFSPSRTTEKEFEQWISDGVDGLILDYKSYLANPECKKS